MKIYKLNFNANKYGGLFLPETEEEKYFQYKKKYFGQCNSSISTWNGLKIAIEDYTKLSDITTLPFQLIFSKKAKDCLIDLIEQDVEFWKLDSESGHEYYLTNVLSCPEDSIDLDKSMFSRYKDGGISEILNYKFLPNLIMNYHIFKLPFGSNEYYISENFKEIIESKELTGLQFFPEGHKWCNLVWESK